LEGHFVDRDQVARIRVIIERRAAPHGQMRSTPADVYPTVVLPADYPAAETASAPSCNRRHSPSAPITPSTPASRPRSPGALGRPFDRGDEITSAASYTSICWSHDVTEFSAPTRHLVFRSFCGSSPGGGPGCEDGPGFLRGGLLRA
jgi:hypothetical protein